MIERASLIALFTGASLTVATSAFAEEGVTERVMSFAAKTGESLIGMYPEIKADLEASSAALALESGYKQLRECTVEQCSDFLATFQDYHAQFKQDCSESLEAKCSYASELASLEIQMQHKVMLVGLGEGL